MPDADLFKLIVAQGGFAIIALLIFVAYRKDIGGTATVLIQVVRDNTASNMELVTLLRALHDRLDNETHTRTPRREPH
jgi:hypothetical protein